MSDGSMPSPPSVADQYSAAIDTCRTTVKWVLSSFAAVAAALIAGVQLTSLGQLRDGRLAWSVVAAIVGFGCVFAIVLSSVRALMPTGGTYSGFAEAPEFQPLRDVVIADPALLRGKAANLADLAKNYEDALVAESEAYEQYKVATDDKQLTARYKSATAERAALFPTVQGLTSLGVYLHVRKLCDQTFDLIKVLVPLAAIAAGAFAYAANPPSSAAKPAASISQTGP